jgi:hypothetical protein
MKESNLTTENNISLKKLFGLIFIPTTLLTITYVIAGSLQQTIPSILLFFLLATLILFPIELGVVLLSSKKEYGSYSLKSAFSNYKKMSWWKILLYGFVLFGFAGLMTVLIAPLEQILTAPLADRFTNILPEYFNWYNIELLKGYSNNILMITVIVFFLMNVIVGPIVEELFFRGYLTSKISRYGKWAPLIVTVLFSIYHLWLPFNNLFRIAIFFPAAYIAWKERNIFITIAFHIFCNLFSTISIIIAIYS